MRADADALTCTSVLFLVLGADNYTSICTAVLLLVVVQMLVLVMDRIPTE